jgi:hypothetical protein
MGGEGFAPHFSSYKNGKVPEKFASSKKVM